MRLCLVFLILAALVSFGSAHQPLWNDGSPSAENAWPIDDPLVSKAVFGRLDAPGVAFFALDAPDGFALDAQVFAGGACVDGFRPQLWLLRPNATNRTPGFALPDGYGAVRADGAWTPYRGHGLTGRAGPELGWTLPGGRYYLVVQADRAGTYLLSLGGREAFGGSAEGLAGIDRFNRCR